MPSPQSPSGIPEWVQLVFGGGIAAVFIPWASKKLDRVRALRKARRAAPMQAADHEIEQLRTDIEALQTDGARVNTWLLGTRDPFTGALIGNGFKDDYPRFKQSVEDGFTRLEQAIAKNGNGNGAA